MFKIKTIREKLLIGIFLGCFIPYLLGGLYIDRYSKNWLYNDEIRHIQQLLSQTSIMVDESFIKKMESEVIFLSGDERLMRESSDIRNYTTFNPELRISMPVSPQERAIENLFENIRSTNENINFVFFGTSDGAYMESPEFAPTDKYDPRIRPWYQNAMYSNDVLISSPYMTKFTQDMVVSFTKKVDSDDKKSIAVVGISVTLSKLAENISEISHEDEGYVIAIDDKNTILIDPIHSDWQLKTIQEVGSEMLNQLDFSDNEVREISFDGSTKIINTYVSPYSNWKYIFITERSHIISDARRMTGLIVAVYTLTLFIIFLFVYFYSKRITQPILEITDSINALSEFNFDSESARVVKKFEKRADEIGTISRSLLNMDINYKELSQKMSGLEDELKRIDITKSTSYQLTLSEKNPFNNFTVSVNKLLSHIHMYLNELKATEEELIAQVDEINRQKEYINFIAEHDSLTQLPNRRKFLEALNDALLQKRSGAVILLDLDNFKSINDTLGHVFGDKVLQHISEKLSKIASETVFVSRFGGDEFLILCLENPSVIDIKALVKSIKHIFSKRINIEGNEIEIKFSMGITMFPEDSNDVNQLIMNADLALYSVKNKGKNGYSFFKNDMTEHLINRSNVEIAMRDAIENDNFYMVYQPQVNLKTGEVMAFEALLRMGDGSYMPDTFIPIAEDNGMIIKIGRLVTSKVISQIAVWISKGYNVKPVAINFSGIQIHDSKYISFLKEQLEIYNVPASLIEIEITENVFIENRDSSLELMHSLKSMGIQISIDDFGTGYSSLSYLTFLPIDKIKLDRSLNLKFLEIENIKVMDSLILLAHSLKLKVVAEGIEEAEQVRRLKIGVCDGIQGYYFSRPLTLDEIEEQFNHNYTEKLNFN